MSDTGNVTTKAVTPGEGREAGKLPARRTRLLGERPLPTTERVRRHRARKREERMRAALVPVQDPAGSDESTGPHVQVLTAVGRLELMLASLRRDLEHGPMIQRRLTALERLVRGDPGLAKAPRHSRGRSATTGEPTNPPEITLVDQP